MGPFPSSSSSSDSDHSQAVRTDQAAPDRTSDAQGHRWSIAGASLQSTPKLPRAPDPSPMSGFWRQHADAGSDGFDEASSTSSGSQSSDSGQQQAAESTRPRRHSDSGSLEASPLFPRPPQASPVPRSRRSRVGSVSSAARRVSRVAKGISRSTPNLGSLGEAFSPSLLKAIDQARRDSPTGRTRQKGKTPPGTLYDAVVGEKVVSERGRDPALLAQDLLAERVRFKKLGQTKFDQAVAKRAPITIWEHYAHHLSDPSTAPAFFAASLAFSQEEKHPYIVDGIMRAIHAFEPAAGENLGGAAAAAAAAPRAGVTDLQKAVLEAIVATGDQQLVVACADRFPGHEVGRTLLALNQRSVMSRAGSVRDLRALTRSFTSSRGAEPVTVRDEFMGFVRRFPENPVTAGVVDSEVCRGVTAVIVSQFHEVVSKLAEWPIQLKPALQHHTPTCRIFDPLTSDIVQYKDFRIVMEKALGLLGSSDIPEDLRALLVARRMDAEEIHSKMGVPAAAHLFASTLMLHWSSQTKLLKLQGDSQEILNRMGNHLLAMAIKLGVESLEPTQQEGDAGAAGAGAAEGPPALSTEAQVEVDEWRIVHALFRVFIDRISSVESRDREAVDRAD